MPVASSASSSSSWRPGSRRSAASQPSPEVPRPNRPDRSPSTATQTSAALAAAAAAASAGVVPAEYRAALRVAHQYPAGSARSASSTVGTSTPSGSSGWCTPTCRGNE